MVKHSLYKLDWTRKSYKCNNDSMELNMEYESLLDNMIFSISEGYLSEIRRAAWMSIYELNQKRDIDSSQKHIYFDPVISYIYEAFYLLSDCVFDESAGYYYRGPYVGMILYLLLYKFWKNQVNNMLILKYCRIDELMAKSYDTGDTETGEKINLFLQYIDSELSKDISNG